MKINGIIHDIMDEKIKAATIHESDEIIEDSDYIFFAVPSGNLRIIIKIL